MKDAADLGGLKAYLTGMGRNNPATLAFVAGYADWPKLASQELDRRAVALLAGLADANSFSSRRGSWTCVRLPARYGRNSVRNGE